MKLKLINITFCSILILAAILFGISTYTLGVARAANDNSHLASVAERINEETRNIANRININNINHFHNNRTGFSPNPTNPDVIPVVFDNAFDLLAHAVTNLNNATQVQSRTTSGRITLESASFLGVPFTNIVMPLEFQRYRSGAERLIRIRSEFHESIPGISPPPHFNYLIHYTNGAVYDIFTPIDHHITLTRPAYVQRFGNFNISTLWHFSDISDVAKLTEDDIIMFMRNPDDTYRIEIDIQDVAAFDSNFGELLISTIGSGTFAFSRINLIMEFDRMGNFRRITYNETASGAATVLGVSANIARVTQAM